MSDILNNNNIKLLAEHLPVEDQYELAKSLAANCGYQLVESEQDERTIEIKQLLEEFKIPGVTHEGWVANEKI